MGGPNCPTPPRMSSILSSCRIRISKIGKGKFGINTFYQPPHNCKDPFCLKIGTDALYVSQVYTASTVNSHKVDLSSMLWIYHSYHPALGGLVHCPQLTGAAVFCFLMAILAISLGCICCCYHWVKDEEDLPFAIFCVGYCLLLLFIFTVVTGTTVVFTEFDLIFNTAGNSTAVPASCGMTELPFGTLIISYFLGALFVVISLIACILALGATSDVDD